MADTSVASAIVSRCSSSRTCTTASGRSCAFASSDSASGPARTIGSRVSCRSIARTARTASSRPGSCAGIATRRTRGGGGQLVHPGTEQVRGHPVGDLDRALGERRLRVTEQAQRAGPAQRGVAVERRHDVRRRHALALEQVPDEPRARQLARDVVLQVRVQPAVARVELGRRADAEHGGVQQVEPERARRGPQPLVGARRGVALRQPQRGLVRDVEAAERVARVRVRRRDALDRSDHAAVDEVEADRVLGIGGGRVAHSPSLRPW